jgi:hypothetical protein
MATDGEEATKRT